MNITEIIKTTKKITTLLLNNNTQKSNIILYKLNYLLINLLKKRSQIKLNF